MAAIAPSVLARQCLDRRFTDKAAFTGAVARWQARRNCAGAPIHWCFRTADARSKPCHLYPTIPE
jgi:hypothetical protein